MLNPAMKAKKLAYILNNSGARAIVAQTAKAPVVRDALAAAPEVRHVVWVGPLKADTCPPAAGAVACGNHVLAWAAGQGVVLARLDDLSAPHLKLKWREDPLAAVCWQGRFIALLRTGTSKLLVELHPEASTADAAFTRGTGRVAQGSGLADNALT